MKRIVFILVGIIALVSLLAFTYGGFSITTHTTQPTRKLMSIETYISQNISTLSPIAASLGGTFYVTGVKVDGGYGTVNYEDGHNAYIADFTYTANDLDGININSFVIRK